MTSRELAHATELPDWQQAVGDVVFDWWVAARRLECSTQLCTLLGLSRMPTRIAWKNAQQIGFIFDLPLPRRTMLETQINRMFPHAR